MKPAEAQRALWKRQNGHQPSPHVRNDAWYLWLRELVPVSSRVGIIYVRNSTLSVATVGTIGDMVVAGLAEDGAIEAASPMAAPVGPISLGGRGRGGENSVDVGDILKLGLQGLMGHSCHLKSCRRGPDL